MTILEAVGRYFTLKRVGRVYYSTTEHDSLILNSAKNTFSWYSKGQYGSVEKFFRLMGDNEAADEYKDDKSFTLDDFVYLLARPQEGNYKEVYGYSGGCEYLRSRGIEDSTVEAWEIEHTDDRIIFPTVNNKGDRATIIRFTDPNTSSRYKNYGNLRMWPHPTAYGITLDENVPIVLFEGIFSVLRFWQMDKTIQAFASLTSNYYFPLSVFANFQKICIVGDSDNAGYDAIELAIKIRPSVKYIHPAKMPDEMTNEEILHTLSRIKKLCE